MVYIQPDPLPPLSPTYLKRPMPHFNSGLDAFRYLGQAFELNLVMGTGPVTRHELTMEQT